MKFPLNIEEARKVQHELKKKARIVPLKKQPRIIAGVDAAFTKNRIVAVACLLTYPGLEPIEDRYAAQKITFPYVPGFLSFREGPAIIRAVKRLSVRPDIILFDGQGIAHPEGLGIASHIGVILDVPSIGCAKSRLTGAYNEPGARKGNQTSLCYKEKAIGKVLRTRDNVRPLFVSPGHLIDIDGAVDIVMKCVGKYRIPEPIRRADALSKKLKQRITRGDSIVS
jgi:deoxyribonuclease V